MDTKNISPKDSDNARPKIGTAPGSVREGARGDGLPAYPSFLPVVHCDTREQTARNIRVAIEGGADGVFLIGHGMPAEELSALCLESRDRFPDTWLGVNFLDLTPKDAILALPPSFDALWIDDLGMSVHAGAHPAAHKIRTHWDAREKPPRHRPQMLFGGVAFKYQVQPQDLAGVTRDASAFADVITTSGLGTGIAPDLEKIERMRTVLDKAGSSLLAIASGITVENIAAYLGKADAFLVATALSADFYNFDPRRVRALAERIRARRPAPSGV